MGEQRLHWRQTYIPLPRVQQTDWHNDVRLWSRIWIVQELSCAKKVLLLAPKDEGTKEMVTLDWETLSRFLNLPSTDRYH